MKRANSQALRRTLLSLIPTVVAAIGLLALASSAMAEAWTNETAMRESTYVPGRNTFIYDPGKGAEISRTKFVQPLLAGYFENNERGFDANFLTWAPKRKLELGPREWSGCVEYAHPEPCPTGYYDFAPVSHAIKEGPITVLYWKGAFIATVCGNFSNGGAGPIPTITGVKYEDLNGNGKRDAGEPGLSGWTIKLRHAGNVVATTTTGSGGGYSFHLNVNKNPQIGAGTFKVEEVLKPGWVASQTPGSFEVPFGAEDKTYSGRDFGNYRPATIAGHKFDDSNVNGKWDPLESGLGEWTIPLSNGENRVTDGEGAFSFSVRPGTYTVSEQQQKGWRQTNPLNPGTHTYTVISGQVVEHADFGNVCLGGASIAPVDTSTGEPVPMKVRLEEVSVPGILENEPSLPRTETGTPTFGELLPGTYRVVAFLPEGVFTTDPDAVPIEGHFAIVKEIVVSECETTEVPIDLFTESTPGTVTGGVKIDLPDEFATSGFVFMTKPDGPTGNLQYNDHRPSGLELHTSMIEAIWIEGDVAFIWGQVQVDGSLQRFRLRLVDAGEPGTDDRYELTLAGGYKAGFGETLSGGNIQIH